MIKAIKKVIKQWFLRRSAATATRRIALDAVRNADRFVNAGYTLELNEEGRAVSLSVQRGTVFGFSAMDPVDIAVARKTIEKSQGRDTVLVRWIKHA